MDASESVTITNKDVAAQLDKFKLGNFYMNGEDQVGAPFDIAVPAANSQPTLRPMVIPEPDYSILPRPPLATGEVLNE